MRIPQWGSNYAFYNGSLKHAAVLLALGAAACAIVIVGRRLSLRRCDVAERVAGTLLVGVWLAGFVFDLANPRATTSTTLPIHWCDVCGALAVFVMFKPEYRLPRVLLHFWALCFCSFAFALPAIGLGPAFVDFWIYFGTHTAIILTATYDVGVRGFVPGRRDLIAIWAATTGWTLFLQPINFALGANYGFVGPDDHGVRAIITSMGAWPWRLAPMLTIALGMMAALMVVERTIAMAIVWMSHRGEPLPAPYSFPVRAQTPNLAEAA